MALRVTPDDPKNLLRREAAFWDRQEDAIEAIYSRPHDWRFVPDLAKRIMRPKYRFIQRMLGRTIRAGTTHVEIGCGNGWFCHELAKYGVRSTNPEFWAASDWFHEEYQRQDPLEAGIYDLMRYDNR